MPYDGRKVFSLNDAYITIYREETDAYGVISYVELWRYVYVQDLDILGANDTVREYIYGTKYPNIEVNNEAVTLSIGMFYFNKARTFLAARDPSELYRFTIDFQEIEDPNQWDQFDCYSCKNARWGLAGRDNQIVTEPVVYIPSRIE